MKKIAFLILTMAFFLGNAQKELLSENAEISMITIANGKLLNDSFGHSAIRVKDQKFDKMYNYGMFDFQESGFYIKFMRGKLLYNLDVESTQLFLRYYAQQNREIKEQVLRLNQTEKQQFFDFLENNAKPENKKYLYDFFFDNCATKLREVTTNVLNDKVKFHDESLVSDFTFRDLIHQKLTNQVWGKFGIDIALGSVIDRKASAKESTFLPSYVFKNFEYAMVVINDKEVPIVKKTNYLYKSIKRTNNKKKKTFSLTPMWLFTIIAFIVVIITFFDYRKDKPSKWLDILLHLSTSLVGLIVFLLWFATDHKATANNFNLFWAFFPNIILVFYQLKNKKILKNYYLFLLILLGLTVIFWIFNIQKFNLAIIPILIMLTVRYFYKWTNLKTIR